MSAFETGSKQNDDDYRVVSFLGRPRESQGDGHQIQGQDLISNPSTDSNFQFITSLGPPTKARDDVASSRLVRVHAMRSFVRQKASGAESAASRSAQAQQTEAEFQRTATGKFKLASWSRKSNRKSKVQPDKERNHESEKFQSSINILELPMDLGPSVALNIIANPQTYRLIHHYHNDFTQNSVAVNPEGRFFDFALTDAALMHAMLSLVALHLDLNCRDSTLGRMGYFQAIHHQAEAVRDINRRLSVPGAHLSDGLIGAVAILANGETMNGTQLTSTMHMAGLKKMVNLRGGLREFEHNRILQRVLTWADFAYSTTWNQWPLFPLQPDLSASSSTLETMLQRMQLWEPQYCQRPLEIVQSDVRQVMHGLQFVSSAISLRPDDVSLGSLSNMVYYLEHRLLSLKPNPADTGTLPDFQVDLSKMLLPAAHLFLHLAIRELPKTAKMHLNMLNILEATIPEDPTFILLQKSNSALQVILWVLFIGSAAAHGQSTQFMERLRQTCISLGLSHQDDFSRALKSVLWSEKFCGHYSSVIWVGQEIFSNDEP